MYGDVFGVLPKTNDADVSTCCRSARTLSELYPKKLGGEPVDRSPWGELEPEEGAFIMASVMCSSHMLRSCRRGVRVRRRVRGGGGHRGTSADGWPPYAVGPGDTVWHDQRCFNCCWRSRDSRLPRAPENYCSGTERSYGRWPKVALPSGTRETDLRARPYGQRAGIRCQCRCKR